MKLIILKMVGLVKVGFRSGKEQEEKLEAKG